MDQESSSNDSNISTGTDDTPEEVDDLFDVNLTQIPVAERSRERTFGNGNKLRDMDKVKNMSYQYTVTQLMEHEGIMKHGKKAVEALMKEQLNWTNSTYLSHWTLLHSPRKRRPYPFEYLIY